MLNFMNYINNTLKSIKEIRASGFAKNVMMVTGGSVFAQALSVLMSPIVTRIYAPKDYGIMTLYISFLGMVNLLGSLTYDDAIPIADDDENAFNVLVLCFMILFFITLVMFLLLFNSNYLFVLFNTKELIEYKYLIPIGFFLTGIYMILSKWALRQKDYLSIAKTKYSQSIVANLTKIIYGLTLSGPLGLIFGSIFSQSAGIITLIKPNVLYFKKLAKQSNAEKVKYLAKRYLNFPLFSTPGLFVLSLSGQLPAIFISALYGTTVVGHFGLALGITFMPMTLVGKSVQDVFYGEAASLGCNNPARVRDLSNKLLKKLILFGSVPLIILLVGGPILFSFVFGARWETAGEYSRILSLFVFCHLIFHPISVVFSIFEEQKKSFLLSFLRLALVIITFTIAKEFVWKPTTTILMFSVLMSLVEFTKYVMAQRIMRLRIIKSS